MDTEKKIRIKRSEYNEMMEWVHNSGQDLEYPPSGPGRIEFGGSTFPPNVSFDGKIKLKKNPCGSYTAITPIEIIED